MNLNDLGECIFDNLFFLLRGELSISLSIIEIDRISSYNRITIPVYIKIVPKAGRAVVSPLGIFSSSRYRFVT